MARFVSRYRNQRYVIAGETPVLDANGVRVGTKPGRYIEFQDHVYETDDEQEIEFLRSQLGAELTEITGVQASVAPQEPEVDRVASTATVSRGAGQYRCSYCGRAFRSANALAVHVATSHPSVESEPAAAEA